MPPTSDLLSFAVDLARRAGDVTLKYFGCDVAIDLKADASPVTVADREAETLIRAEIEKRFPDHGIIGEEHGTVRPESEYQWVIDPIDGTKSFVRGVPLYGVLIGLERGGESCLGVIHHPALDLTIYAETGAGAFRNGEPTRVAEARSVEETAILCSDYAMLHEDRPGFFAQSVKRYPLQRTWGDCYGYTLVASGQAQAMIDPRICHWDIAALKPIIEEAGGVFTDLRGTPTTHGEHSIGATPNLHRELIEMLSNCG